MQTRKLSSLPLELLKIYSFEPRKKELTNIKAMLAAYFANKHAGKIRKAIKENNISSAQLEKWVNENK